MRYARIYLWRRTRRSRAPSNGPEAYFVAQFSAGYTTNMFGFDLRQGQAKIRSISLSERPLTGFLQGPAAPRPRAASAPDRAGCRQYQAESRIGPNAPARRAPARLSATPPRLMQRPCAMASRPRPDLPSSGSFHSTPQRPAAVYSTKASGRATDSIAPRSAAMQ